MPSVYEQMQKEEYSSEAMRYAVFNDLVPLAEGVFEFLKACGEVFLTEVGDVEQMERVMKRAQLVQKYWHSPKEAPHA